MKIKPLAIVLFAVWLVVFLCFSKGGSRSNGAGLDRRQLDRLIDAVAQVESRGRADAVGDSGDAVGLLQIHPETILDANRIMGRNEFAMTDRLDGHRSREVFRVIARHYSSRASAEVVARRWNGGPRGERKAVTRSYWLKVRNALRSL